MALVTMQNAVAQAFFDAQLETLGSFKSFCSTQKDVDAAVIMQLIADFQATLKTPKISGKKSGKAEKGSDEKKKRTPTAYNLFSQYHMKQLKLNNTEKKSNKTIMAEAATLWRAVPEEAKKALMQLLKEQPDMTSDELVNTLNAKYLNSKAAAEDAEEEDAKDAEAADVEEDA